MKYKDALKNSMEQLALDKRIIFLGYNVNYGSRAYGTLKGIPPERCLETPLAENLMTGIAMGLSLRGFRPILFFERQDFILNALDGIVNHLDKIAKMSLGEYNMPVIIRAVVGGKRPIDPGLQHTQDFTDILKRIVNFPVIDLRNSKQISREYPRALDSQGPIMFVERRDLYEKE